jgi:hypothetical protein
MSLACLIQNDTEYVKIHPEQKIHRIQYHVVVSKRNVALLGKVLPQRIMRAKSLILLLKINKKFEIHFFHTRNHT